MAKKIKTKSGSKSKAKTKTAKVKVKAKTTGSSKKPKAKVLPKAKKKAVIKGGKLKGKVKPKAKAPVKASVRQKSSGLLGENVRKNNAKTKVTSKVVAKTQKKTMVSQSKQSKPLVKPKTGVKKKAITLINKTIKPIEKVKEKKLSPDNGNGNSPQRILAKTSPSSGGRPLADGPKLRYSDKDLVEFKGIIIEKLAEARKDLELLRSSMSHLDDHGTDDTSPTFKLMEDGSDVLTKEETAQLAARQQKFIKHLEDAMVRIENKSYGICRVTGNLIPKERLRVVPHATLSIEAKQKQF